MTMFSAKSTIPLRLAAKVSQLILNHEPASESNDL